MISSLYIIDDDYRYIETINDRPKYSIRKTVYRGYVIFTWYSEDRDDFWLSVRDKQITHNGYINRHNALENAAREIDNLVKIAEDQTTIMNYLFKPYDVDRKRA